MTSSATIKGLVAVLLFLLPSLARAQGGASLIRSSPEPLPNCNPAVNGQAEPILWDTTAGNLRVCSATNVWSAVSSSGITSGRIALAAGTAVLTFGTPYASAPICIAEDVVTISTVQCVTTTTTATFTGIGADVVQYLINGIQTGGGGGGGGSGNVLSFAAGNLAPLFTTSVATPTTTPVLSFALSNAAANTVFGNCTSGSAAPSYCSILAAMQPSTTVNAVTNDTNVTGSIAGQTLTLGWTGLAAKSRTLATTVYEDQANTYTTGLQDFTAATFKLPNSAGAAPTVSGLLAYDTTLNRLVAGINGATQVLPWFTSGTPVNAQCVTWSGTSGLQGSLACLTGTLNSAQQFALAYYSGAGVNNQLSGIAGPTAVNGVAYIPVSIPSGGVATLPVMTPGGVANRAVVVTSDTILATDRGKRVTYNNGGAIAVALPQAGTTGFDQGFVFVVKNKGAGTVTVTPATSTIDGGATLPIVTNRTCYIYLDSTGTNYETSCFLQS